MIASAGDGPTLLYRTDTSGGGRNQLRLPIVRPANGVHGAIQQRRKEIRGPLFFILRQAEEREKAGLLSCRPSFDAEVETGTT